MRHTKDKSQAGFSLLELLVVVAIFTVIMGALASQINTSQKRYLAEQTKMDITQESREFVDQIVRDLHQAGYPNSKMYGAGVLGTGGVPVENDPRNAVGLVKFAYDEIGFEADVDGDGVVDSVNYKLISDGVAGSCPCQITRSQQTKVTGAPYPQTIVASTGLQNVVNSGGANGADGVAAYTITGNAAGGVSNDVVYSTYKNANVFTAYDSKGAPVLPTDYVTNKAQLKSIRTIKINVNLLTGQADLQSQRRPVVTVAASVRLPAN